MKKRISKTELVKQWMIEHPNADQETTCKKFKCSNPTFYKARALARNGEPEPEPEPKLDLVEFYESNLDGLISDLHTIRNIGVNRVKAILELIDV